MRIAICDDEMSSSEQTKQTLEEAYKSLDMVVDVYQQGKRFLEACEKIRYDLVILDIEMPGMDGISVAKTLRETEGKTAIVFLTSHIEYALKGYEVRALRYLTKPATPEKLSEIIGLMLRHKKEKKQLLLKEEDELLMVAVEEIIYLEARNQDIRVVTADSEYLRRYNLKDYEHELSGYDFFRCHRSYLINLAKIKRVAGREVFMENGENIPISRTREKALKEALYEYVQREAF